MRLSLTLLLLLVLTTVPVFAQPPAATCGPGAALDGGDTLPVDVAATLVSDDFTLTGTGCDERGNDHVTCFVPTNSCSVDASCSFGTLVQDSGEKLGLQVAVNVVEGTCNTSPASCVASDAGTGTGSVTGVALTGGTEYCFVCEANDTISIELQVQTASGDCGSLPVELTKFEIN